MRIDSDDSILNMCLGTAITRVEQYLARPLITQTYTISGDNSVSARGLGLLFAIEVEMPFANLLSLESFYDYDEDSETYTLVDPDNYVLNNNDLFGVIYRVPTTFNGYKLIANFGYGPDPDDIPDGIKLCILKLAALLWENNRDSALETSVLDDISTFKAYS